MSQLIAPSGLLVHKVCYTASFSVIRFSLYMVFCAQWRLLSHHFNFTLTSSCHLGTASVSIVLVYPCSGIIQPIVFGMAYSTVKFNHCSECKVCSCLLNESFISHIDNFPHFMYPL